MRVAQSRGQKTLDLEVRVVTGARPEEVSSRAIRSS